MGSILHMNVCFRMILVLACSIPAVALAALQFRYDTEYEAIQYSASTPSGAVAQLLVRIAGGEVTLQAHAENGYLASLLRELGIDVDTQVLVFSKTSLQVNKISPLSPRAIYFNDSVYVAWVPGGLIEISSVDPKLGIVFYTLEQQQLGFERHTTRCLECHDTYSLTGGGVPRHLVGSGFIDQTGALASHEGWILTTDQTPIRRRWGGWYVTGTHGEQIHMGNVIIRSPEQAANLDLSATGNVKDLASFIDTRQYLGDHSDIVALMVLEHQAHVQNVITRVNYDTRMALHNQKKHNRELGRNEDFVAEETMTHIQSIVEPLVRTLLLVDEAPLSDTIAGTSGFAERFTGLGPFDAHGRSLRQFDLTRRLFRYPCSYVIYSEAFNALPDMSKTSIYQRLREVLGGTDRSGVFVHLSAADREAILEILESTKPEFAAS
tara:strand:+ start:3168 stop:4475 length:1308 start_codon:yes stop_codon:yes gene_type:complete